MIDTYKKFLDGNSYSLEQLWYELGERDFKIRLSNNQYIAIIEKDNIEINMVMPPIIVDGPIQLIHNLERYRIRIDLNDNLLIIELFAMEPQTKYHEVFRMNFNSYSVERPLL